MAQDNSAIKPDAVKACVLGLAVADALGVPVEFRPRSKLEADPVTGMRAYGTHNMPAGTWSDDTSMTLCALDALAREKFSWECVMENFGRWRYNDEFTATGRLFDIGGTCSTAIHNYAVRHMGIRECGETGANSNGNGSLMRIIPFALYGSCHRENLRELIETGSALTHAHLRSKIACYIYSEILLGLIATGSKESVGTGIGNAKRIYGDTAEWPKYEPLFSLKGRNADSIKSGGYVVDTLEAALWCFETTDSYAGCVLKAVNLGSDTDTVAAVAGGLAGAFYGLDGIPREWKDTLLRRDYIEDMCEKAAARWSRD